MSKDKTELLKKLKTLSKYGVGGEKIEAEKALNKIMQKYHINEEDIKEDDYREIKIRFKGKEEEKILYQICYKILGTKERLFSSIYQYKRGSESRNTRLIICSSYEAAQIILYFDFYKEIWKKEKDLLMEAFIQKNELYGVSSENNSKECDRDHLMEIMKRVSMMKDNDTPCFRIEATNN